MLNLIHSIPMVAANVTRNALNTIVPVLETPQLVARRARVREVELPETRMKRRLGLAYRKHGYLSPLADRVAAILRKHGGALLAL